MTDVPELSGPDAAVHKAPAQVVVPHETIKSDEAVVGGVLLGAIKAVELDAEKYSSMVDTGINAALRFRPIRVPPTVAISPLVQLKQDVLAGASAYLTTRRAVGRQLETILRKQAPTHLTSSTTDQQPAINALILERTLHARLQAVDETNQKILTTNQNLLQFHTGPAHTFMKQSLALNYHQLYNTKNLLTLIKAFAEMAESKLEAIKINTKLPDHAKFGIIRRIKETAKKEMAGAAIKAVSGHVKKFTFETAIPGVANYLSHPERQAIHLPKSVSAMVNRATASIRGTQHGRAVLDHAQDSFQSVRTAMGPTLGRMRETATAFDQRHNLSSRYHPDVLWQKTHGQRQHVAQLLRSLAGKSPEAIKPAVDTPLPHGAAAETAAPRAPPHGIDFGTPPAGVSKHDLHELVTNRLDKIYTLLEQRLVSPTAPIRSGSFADHNRRNQEQADTLQAPSRSRATGSGVVGMLGSLLGYGKKRTQDSGDGDSGGTSSGIVDHLEEGAAVAAGGAAAAKAKTLGSRVLGLGKTVVKGLWKGGKAIAGKLAGGGAGVAAARSAEAVAAKSAPGTIGRVVSAVAGLSPKLIARGGIIGAAALGGIFLAKRFGLMGGATDIVKGVNDLYHGEIAAGLAETASAATSFFHRMDPIGTFIIGAEAKAYAMRKRVQSLTGTRGDLLAARMKIYGAPLTLPNADATLALETRAVAVVMKNAGKIKYDELQDVAKSFGFDPKNSNSMEYFHHWLSNRFFLALRTYIAILQKYNYTLDTEASIPPDIGGKIIAEYTKAGAKIAETYKDFAPSPAAFLALIAHPHAAGNTPTEIPPRPVMAPNTPATQPAAPASPVSVTSPESSTVTPTAEIPTGAGPALQKIRASNVLTFTGGAQPPARSAAPNTTPTGIAAPAMGTATLPSLPANSGGRYSALPTADRSTGVASIAKLSYTGGGASAANSNTLPIAGGQSFSSKAPGVMQNLMKDFGLSKEQAAGIVGNLGHESAGFKSMQEKNPLGGGRGGLGWAQWTGPRRVSYEAYCRDCKLDPSSDAANYGYLKHELQTTYKSTVAAVKQANTSSEAMQAFEKHYEAAGVKHYESRQNYTNIALKNFGDGADPAGGGTQVASASQPNSTITASFDPTSQSTQGGVVMGSSKGLPQGAVGSGQSNDTGLSVSKTPSSSQGVVAQATTSSASGTTPSTSPPVGATPSTLASSSSATPPVSPPNVTPPASVQTNATVQVGPRQRSAPAMSPSQAPFQQPGPSETVMAPMRTAMLVAQKLRQDMALLMHPPKAAPQPQPVPGVHPEMLANSKAMVDTLQQSLAVLGGLHTSMQGVHNTLQDAHGNKGVFAGMTEMLAKATTQQPTVFAPTINTQQTDKKKGKDDDGLDVSKKREPRYAA